MLKRVALGVVFASQKGLLWAGAVTLVALAAACGGTDQQAVNPASPSVSTAAIGANQAVSSGTAAAQAAKGPKTVPRSVTGTLDGRFIFEGPWEGPWTTTGDAAGTLTHLGLARIRTTHTASPDGTISGGTFEIAAANGDSIQGSYTASGVAISYVPYIVAGTAALRIEQGTGRFDGATGTIEATFLETLDADYSGAHVRWTLSGTVNY
jgi:hypothetical protein